MQTPEFRTCSTCLPMRLHAGAGLSGKDFLPQITSYDYGAPLSEQGRTGQPGIGGANKYEVILLFRIPSSNKQKRSISSEPNGQPLCKTEGNFFRSHH